MAIIATQVPVGTTATILGSLDTSYQVNSPYTHSILISPVGDIFIGESTVTIATGYKIKAGTEIALDLSLGEALYGVCAAGTVVVSVLRVGV